MVDRERISRVVERVLADHRGVGGRRAIGRHRLGADRDGPGQIERAGAEVERHDELGRADAVRLGKVAGRGDRAADEGVAPAVGRTLRRDVRLDGAGRGSRVGLDLQVTDAHALDVERILSGDGDGEEVVTEDQGAQAERARSGLRGGPNEMDGRGARAVRDRDRERAGTGQRVDRLLGEDEGRRTG